MQIDILKSFYDNNVIRDAVHDYLISFLEEKVIERAFAGKEVKDIAEAKTVIEKAFANLEGKYENKKNINTSPR
jgi:hypothetical protein